VILVAGVAELFQGDLDLGRRAVERLAEEDLGPGVLVEELSYGAVAVAQRLEDVRPEALVLVGASRRGREPGSVERREVVPPDLPVSELQLAVGDAVTGYVSIDLLVEVAGALGALPPRAVAVEVEPASTGPSEELTPTAREALEGALNLVRLEVAECRAAPGAGGAPPSGGLQAPQL
jgi:hydrogenase maturation protease